MHATDFCLIDTILHYNPDLVIDWIYIWAIWVLQVQLNKVCCFFGAQSQRLHMQDALSAFYKVVQQHNFGDAANTIPHLCADT